MLFIYLDMSFLQTQNNAGCIANSLKNSQQTNQIGHSNEQTGAAGFKAQAS